MEIPLKKIKPPKIKLRPVRKTGVEYFELLNSVKEDGILQPILVRPLGDGYEVVEGNWRRSAAIDAGLETMPCLVKEMTDKEVLLKQLKANAIRPTTTPTEYATRLQKIMKDEDYTVSQMVKLINKNAQWIRKMLKLNNLTDEVKKMVDRGEICVSNAEHLSKLPRKLSGKFIAQAATMPPDAFGEVCRKALKDWREFCQRDKIGWLAYQSSHVVGYLRQLREINAEIKTHNEGGSVLRKMGAKTSMDGWVACLSWLMHLDPESQEQQTPKEDYHHRALNLKEARKQNRIYLKELTKLEN